jgi:hypothetical protein
VAAAMLLGCILGLMSMYFFARGFPERVEGCVLCNDLGSAAMK